MAGELVECVPNFSEGRDADRVSSIVDAMRGDGVFILDREMDADHNRCVVTLAGSPAAVAEAATRGVGRAAELIDLTRHSGVHPRIGAADVVPFIPIDGVTLEDCVVLARQVGQEIWKRFKIPVYLYEAAATSVERQNLENIRRGQFEGLARDVVTDPGRLPDFGSNALHPTAGAAVVGARKALIAYNIYLNASDAEIAKKIAKAVRFSSGGLRFVKAMGVSVRNMAQVSMNLTDFELTPISTVFEFVRREAARYGVLPTSSEIVGLVPKKALEQAAEWFLQLENFDSSVILENRLAMIMGGKMAVGGTRAGVEPFIEALSAPRVVPGGGSAAAAAGAMAAALGQMVADLSRTKKNFQQHEPRLSEILGQLVRLKEQLKIAVEVNAELDTLFMEANRHTQELPGSEAEVTKALKRATETPLGVVEAAHKVEALVEELKPMTGKSMWSDLTAASALAQAAVTGALAKVEINLEGQKDREFADRVRQRISGLTGKS